MWTTSAENPMKEKSKIDAELSVILSDVCKAACVSVDDVIGKSRFAKIVAARQLFCYVARKKTKLVIKNTEFVEKAIWTYRQIGAAINCGSATIIHSYNVVDNMLDTRQPEYVALACRLGIT